MVLIKQLHHHYHSPYKRAAFSFALITIVMTVGTVGMHLIEHMPYLDAFYFMSMIATAQGPILMPATAAGKIFASLISFISVGTVLTSIAFLFGPFFGKVWHVGVMHLEKDLEHLAAKKKH